MSDWNESKIKEIVESEHIVIFAKGDKMQPMCGFSAHAMEIVNRYGKPFKVVNIFDHPDIRPALVAYSKWPTTPQLFVAGELIGGADITEEMHNNGELKKKIEAAFATS